MTASSLSRYLLAALCVLACSFDALAAGDCARGQILYNAPVRGVACSNSTCHGTDLSKNMNWILWGANSAANLAQAIRNGGGGMTVFQGVYTTQDLDDLGAWIGSSPVCPVGAASLSVAPESNLFASQGVGTTSAATVFTVTNGGVLPVTGLTITNSNTTEFPAVTTCGATLTANASCTISVSFKPSAEGTRSATLTIDSSAGEKLIGMYGTGTAGNSATLDLIEYYYAEFDSYFVTALADEVQKLDSGQFVGWVRTGYQFKVQPLGMPGSLTVCRFYSVAFGPKSAHFYTPAPAECAQLKGNRDWTFEAEVFAIPGARPDGTCAGGMMPVYRLYNNGQGGAPNHRYTTVATVRDTMIAAGWIVEGNGPGFGFMCAPQ